MRSEEAYDSYQGKRLSQAEAAVLLGISDRPFRRYLNRYDENGLDGLIDKRLSEVSHRRDEDAIRAFLKEFEKAF